jgi:hypothetical protein
MRKSMRLVGFGKGRRWRRSPALGAGLAGPLLLLVSGCGHSAPAKHATTSPARSSSVSVCLPEARDAVAHFLALPSGGVALAASTGNNAYPQCSFGARTAAGPRVQVIANVDNGPQPYFVLERTAIEAGQQFTTARMIAAPQSVTGLGIEADWFPAETQLMTTDGVRLITISISWPHATEARKRALAELLARTYLRNVKGEQLLAKGFP